MIMQLPIIISYPKIETLHATPCINLSQKYENQQDTARSLQLTHTTPHYTHTL